MQNVRIGCDINPSPTDAQRRSLREIENDVSRLFGALVRDQRDVPVWGAVTRHWDGHVRLGTRHLVPGFVPRQGCLSIGLDSNGSPDKHWRAVCRCICVLIRSVSTPCAPDIDRALTYAETTLQFTIDLSCDDIREYGLIRKPWYGNMNCEKTHDRRRPTFEELLGRDVDEAKAMVRDAYPDVHVVVRHWDLIGESASYDLHAEKETLVIHYDVKSNKVVLPTPQFASAQTMNGVYGNCFLMPDEGRCKGAPRIAPDASWDAMIGGLLTDVVDTMRFNYPHAVVEARPVTYGEPSVRRRDRIQVLFDPQTARVTNVIIG